MFSFFGNQQQRLTRGTFDSPTVQAVLANGVIPVSSFTTNTNCIKNDNGTITVRHGGTYKVSVNVTTIATAAGVEEIQLYRNGTPVPGAHAQGTAAAVGDAVPMSFSTLITVEDCGQTTLTVQSTPATSVRIYDIDLVEAKEN